ncbi:MAG: SGNH/GDSL hydrolase family protein [Clostridia bacterium]|nr:SGNH/GDSL hydrolase family protein [Clostridia bacterium]
MKKVLLLGDSIRLNIQPMVYKLLSDTAEVHGPDDNCRFSRYTLWHLDEWLANEKFDIIYVNCGIWDITRKEHYQNERFTELYEYTRDMTRVVEALKTTGAKIVVASSTPVKKDSDFHKISDIIMYNEALKRVAQNQDVVFIDNFSVIDADKEQYICEDNIHLSKQGIKVLGTFVAENIKKLL